jgi:signal transduction histidine kinase
MSEDELFKTKIDLEEAKRLSDIGTLAATVAHELRNPLGVIQTAVYNIKRKNEQDKLQKHIMHIEKKIAESERIINNLLNYSRMKKPQPKMIHLYNFLEECISTIKNQYQNVDVKLNKNYNVFTDMKVKIDPFQIREVVTNILNNAYQALPEKGGRMRIKGEITDQNEFIIEISDNGEGIDERDLNQIFSPFFTRKSKGTGLGLTICHELLNLNNGSINVQSTKGQGTTVRIMLPLREEGDGNGR